MICRITMIACLSIASLTTPAQGQTPIRLVNLKQPNGGWRFGNGPEFPGATGMLKLGEPLRGQPTLSLHGDFSKGGNYVQAETTLPDVPVDTLSFWVNIPGGSSTLPIRLIDGSGQCHQLRLKLSDKSGWQHVILPVEEYFRKIGTSSALDVAQQYEKWGGAKDGRWHQPGKLLVFLFTRSMGGEGHMMTSDILLHPSRPKVAVQKTIPLDEMLQAGEIDWGLNLGQEFPGARADLKIVADDGKNVLRLKADFTKGGAYVGLTKSLANLDVQSMNVIRLRMRSDTTRRFGLRLVDESGQCHQQRSLPMTADGKWHELKIVPKQIAGGEHWGGANDGTWHGRVRLVELMLNTGSHDGKQPELFLADVEADVVIEALPAAPSFSENFEDSKCLENWRIVGSAAITSAGKSGKAIALKRTLDSVQNPTSATSGAFPVDPGSWQFQFAWSGDLHSPDNSYHGSVALEIMDRTGAVLDTAEIGIGFGKKDWQPSGRTVILPRETAQARFRLQMNKTYGEFRVDDLSASRLTIQPIEQRVDRILLSTNAVGNLFLPGEKRVFHAAVETFKPVSIKEQVLRYSVRDYWGADQIPPAEVRLSKQQRKADRFVYSTEIVLPDSLEIGKYYELLVAIPQNPGEPVTEYSGFAVLPLAITKKYPAEQVPFTIRNWDSRIPAYFHLADRLGLRMMGVWGGWSATPPYKAHCPGVDLCRKLDAKWVTGTPAAQVEREGFAKLTEEMLRKGMRNFLEAYADQGLAMIALGNEPHGVGQKVLDNVRAYRAIYETVKAFDPKIHVIGTSVEPNEEYFKAGYQKHLDSYDFHIYEDYTHVRRTMREYRELMTKYDAVKPLHSTELGLNSQGQTRLAVARGMIKKFAVFFAEGGATASWFTIQYPDPKGNARGQFGDAHCVFDCKCNLYNPRLDAITYYNLVNSICIKKFVQERQYPNGVQAYLFRDADNQCLQVLWLDDKREDVFVPLPANQKITLVRIDGSRQELNSTTGGVTLTLHDDPVQLLYQSDAPLAKSLGSPKAVLVSEPTTLDQGGPIEFDCSGSGLTAESLRILGSPLWKSTLQQARIDRVRVSLRIPPTAAVRELRITVQLRQNESATGELAVSGIRR